MDGGLLLLMTVSFTVVFLMVQRAEVKRRRLVIFFALLIGLVIIWYAITTGSQREALVGFILGRILSLLFWLFIGRYNPVGSSDSIRVLGMDD